MTSLSKWEFRSEMGASADIYVVQASKLLAKQILEATLLLVC